MTRFFAVAVAPVVLALVPAVAQPPGPPVAPWANKLFAPAGTPTPAVILHDFGTVPHGTVCSHTFPLVNVYDVPMQVLDVRRTCGCLEAYPPQKVLQPGEAAEFVVTMNAGKFTGPNAQTVYVTVGGKNFHSAAVLRLQATSRADVHLEPGQVHFGTVAQGARAARAVALDYQGRQRDWTITGAVPPAGPLDVDVKELARTRAGVRYAVTVALKPDAPAGVVSEVVALRTNDPSAPVVQVPVAGVVQAPLTVTPGAVQFGRVRVGEEATYRVLVRAAAPFRVTGVSGHGDGVTASPFPAATPSQVVSVTFRPLKPGPVRRELRLATDLGGAAVVAVEGEGVE